MLVSVCANVSSSALIFLIILFYALKEEYSITAAFKPWINEIIELRAEPIRDPEIRIVRIVRCQLPLTG